MISAHDPGVVDDRACLGRSRARPRRRRASGSPANGGGLSPSVMLVLTKPGFTQIVAQARARGTCDRAPRGSAASPALRGAVEARPACARARPATELNTQSVPPPRASSRLRASSQKTTVLAKSTVSRRRVSSTSASSASCVANRPAVTTTVSKPAERRLGRVERGRERRRGARGRRARRRSTPAALPGARLQIARAARQLLRVAPEQEERRRRAPRAGAPARAPCRFGGAEDRPPSFRRDPRRAAPTGRCAGAARDPTCRAAPAKRGEPRLHPREVLGAGEAILGQVDASAGGDDQLVERDRRCAAMSGATGMSMAIDDPRQRKREEAAAPRARSP